MTKPLSRRPELYLAAFFYLLVIIYHLASARAGYPSYRDQHIGTALEYARGSLNLLNPIIVGFNANHTPTPLELPVWQVLTGLAFKIFGPWFGWGNVVSLLLFATAFYPLYRLAEASFGTIVAGWTMLFFAAQPLVLDQSGRAGTDGFAITTAIWFLFAAERLIETRRWTWVIATALLGALAAVSKLPFFMAAGVASVLLLWSRKRFSLVPWALLAVSGIFSAICFFAWTHYCDAQIARAEFPLVDLRLKNADMVWWYFGDWHYRLSPGNWLKGGWRILNAQFGSFALVGVALLGLATLRAGIAHWMLAGAFLVTLIFSHLVLNHYNYYLMYSPVTAMFLAAGAVKLYSLLDSGAVWQRRAFLSATGFVLLLSLVQGWRGTEGIMQFDPYKGPIIATIAQETKPADKLLIIGGGWGGDELFRTHRDGLEIWNTKILEDPKNLEHLKALGFTKLVVINPSPMLIAVQEVNPGQANMKRENFQAELGSQVDGWPTLFQDQDLLIKNIP